MTITLNEVRSFYDDHNIKKGDRGWMKREKVVAQLTPFLRGDVLEVGCGTGFIAQKVCNNPAVKSYTAIDLSPKSIEKAKETQSKVLFDTADFMEWETDKQFDCVCFFDSLEHFFSWKEAVKKGVSLLKSSMSKVILNVPNPEFTKFFQKSEIFEHILDNLVYLEDLMSEFKKYHKDLVFYHLYSVEGYKQYQFIVFQ